MFKKLKGVWGLLLVVAMLLSNVSPAFATEKNLEDFEIESEKQEAETEEEETETENDSSKDISMGTSIYEFGVYESGRREGPQAYLRWKDKDSSSTGYKIYMSEGNNTNYIKENVYVYKDTAYSETRYYCYVDIDFDKMCYFKIVPVKNGVDGEASEEKSIIIKYVSEGVRTMGIGKNRKPVLYFISELNEYTQSRTIYRATSEKGKYKKIATTNRYIYTDKSAKPGKKYYYKTKEHFYDGSKKYTSSMSRADCFDCKLNEIRKIRIIRLSKTSVKISWDKVIGAKRYSITYEDDDSYFNDLNILFSNKNYVIIKGLRSYENYSFLITAYSKNTGKGKTIGKSVSYNMESRYESYPYVTKRKTSYKNGVFTVKTTIKWNKVYDIDGYYIKYKDNTTGGEFKKRKTLSKNATSYTFVQKYGKKINNSGYTKIKVVPYSKYGEYDNEFCAESHNSCKSVSDVKVKKVSDSKVKISWKKSPEADSYSIYRYDDLDFQFIGETYGNYYITDNISLGKKTLYVVRANNRNTRSSDRNMTQFYYDFHHNDYAKYIDVRRGYDSKGNYLRREYYISKLKKFKNAKEYTFNLSAPKISSIENNDKGKSVVTWKGVAYATSYDIYRATSAKGKYKKVGYSKGLTFVDNKLKKGKTYYYKVVSKAKNEYGKTIYSKKSAYKSVKVRN